jgi:hypothetical protein
MQTYPSLKPLDLLLVDKCILCYLGGAVFIIFLYLNHWSLPDFVTPPTVYFWKLVRQEDFLWRTSTKIADQGELFFVEFLYLKYRKAPAIAAPSVSDLGTCPPQVLLQRTI